MRGRGAGGRHTPHTFQQGSGVAGRSCISTIKSGEAGHAGDRGRGDEGSTDLGWGGGGSGGGRFQQNRWGAGWGERG